jgi:hypothetical protein
VRLGVVAIAVVCAVLAAAGTARADIANFDLGGKIYTKYLFWNNDSQGLVNWGNPFWPDEYAPGGMGGDNGIGSEFELTIKGRVSRYVEAQVRIQSRFGELWQDWWENGNQEYDTPNTSGESLGMDHASYMKLRGYYIRFAPPIPTVDWVHFGASDMGMFNEWTIGKVRYIDRDNGKGLFVLGSAFDDQFRYHAAIIALPRLWVGPGWSTGIGDTRLETDPFYTQDWAYGLRFDVAPDAIDWMRFTLIGTLTHDMEFDLADPDARGTYYPDCTDSLGNPVPGCRKDHDVDWATRYFSSNTTLEWILEPLDWLYIDLLGAVSVGLLNRDYAANQTVDNNGFSPIVTDDVVGYAGRARFLLDDPFDVGLSFKLEYFNIGEDFNAIFGARREADVLLTDGFLEGGQLPTLNIANEFVDFDEDWVETCIGWHGATGIVSYQEGAFDLELEGTVITYNTDGQLRATQDNPWLIQSGQTDRMIYPTFLHTDGYPDTDFWDYANRPEDDRGRDPRSVFHVNQKRISGIAVVKAGYLFDVGRGLDLRFKAKYIRDEDERSTMTPGDDYVGDIFKARLSLSYPLTDEFKITLGTELNFWREDGRKGTLNMEFNELGQVLPGSVRASEYFEDRTQKYKGFLALSYDFEGVHFKWILEYIHKELNFGNPDADSLLWDTWRSKAALEVAW